MEATQTYKQKLFNNSTFSNVMQFFDKKELLELRLVSPKFADEIVPKNISHLLYECEEENGDIPYEFPKRVRHAKKVVIRNICGTIEHL